MDEEIIGRQVGRHFHGAVYRGTTRALGASPVRATASIPSKFETIINVGAKEMDGFGARNHRFHSAETELPGPGNYFTPHDPGQLKPESGSKKGYGAMVSSDKRFKQERRFKAPGPGAYGVKRYQGEPRTQSFSKAATSYQFSNTSANGKASVMRKQADDATRPSPASYQPRAEVQPNRWTGVASTFRSTSDRFAGGTQQNPKKLAEPAPGQYAHHDFFDPNAVTVAKHGALRGQSSAFKSGCARMQGMEGHPNDQAFGAPSVIYGEEMVHPASLVGPGSHHTELFDLKTRTDLQAKHQSSFFSKHSADRFGHQFQPRSKPEVRPGPGSYTAGPYAFAPDTRTYVGSSSAFVSASARLDNSDTAANLSRPPGPAYYSVDKNRVNAHKSYNLNARHRFI